MITGTKSDDGVSKDFEILNDVSLNPVYGVRMVYLVRNTNKPKVPPRGGMTVGITWATAYNVVLLKGRRGEPICQRWDQQPRHVSKESLDGDPNGFVIFGKDLDEVLQTLDDMCQRKSQLRFSDLKAFYSL